MTARRFIAITATRMVVDHVKNYGVPERGLGNLAWECVEGIVAKGDRSSKAYFDSASDEALDHLHAEIETASRQELQHLGVSLNS
jgi:hypothetical protein